LLSDRKIYKSVDFVEIYCRNSLVHIFWNPKLIDKEAKAPIEGANR